MPKARDGLVFLGLPLALLCLALAWFLLQSWLRPAPPRPPSPAELSALESRFPAIRDALERHITAARQRNHEANHLRHLADTLLAAGETLEVRRLEREYDARWYSTGLELQLEGESFFESDSLIYLTVWARRGRGFSAPYHYAGYVYSSRPLGPRFGYSALYRHLDGRWYLFSMRDPKSLVNPF